MQEKRYHLETIFKQEKAFKHFSNFVIKRLLELKFEMEFSNLVKQAGRFVVEHNPNFSANRIAITDIDKILSVAGNIKAFVELKTPVWQNNRKEFWVQLSQFDILRTLSRKLDVPVFYLIKHPDHYRLIKCRFERAALTDRAKRKVRFLNNGIKLNRERLIEALADILQGSNDV
jgi:hypothetical protein